MSLSNYEDEGTGYPEMLKCRTIRESDRRGWTPCEDVRDKTPPSAVSITVDVLLVSLTFTACCAVNSEHV